MIEKKISHDCSVTEDGQIQVREITRIIEDGIEISKTYHRHVVDVGDDVSAEAQLIKDIAGSVHTPARIAARRAAVEAAEQAAVNTNLNNP